MTSPEPAPAEPSTKLTALEYLAGADREWAAGNHQEASALIWKATKATFVRLAEERGLEYDERLIDLAKALESDGSVPEGYYRDNLNVAKLMRTHAEMDVLEDYEIESTFQLARQFLVERHGKHE